MTVKKKRGFYVSRITISHLEIKVKLLTAMILINVKYYCSQFIVIPRNDHIFLKEENNNARIECECRES